MVIHEVINTPFQVAMDCKHVEENADHICWNCTIKIIDMAEQLEAEREMYKQGFDALTTANEQIVKERDEANKKLKEYYAHNSSIIMALYAIDNDVFGPLTVREGIAELVKQRDEARRALAQNVTTRAELLDTIEKLKRENEQLQSEIDYLRSTDHAADLAFERAQKIGARYVIDETPLGIALDGQGDEVEP